MKVQEIQDKILENNNLIKSLQNQVAKLSKENSELAIQKENILIDHFKDYIELGTTYTVSNWMYLNGVQTGLGKDDRSYSPNFQNGDTFEFIKKNSKSIVIKCTNKIKATYKNGVRISEVTENPGWIFRVETISLYQSLLKDPNFAEPYKRYVTRKEALELLGV